jgi:hypothetical protein
MLPPRALPTAHFERNEGASYCVTRTLPQHKLVAKMLQENPEAILAMARRNLRRYIDRRPAARDLPLAGVANPPRRKVPPFSKLPTR